jgi:ADP-ribose pyrophosphatase YjhB (NUDIX family)
MVQIIRGNRVGKNGRLGVGCSASIFDVSGERVLLVRRADNGKWAVPGGYMASGESFSEACKREVQEETGLEINIKRLIGIYTSPNLLLEYPDGNKWQLIVLHFGAEFAYGELKPSEETTEFGFFALSEISELDMNNLDRKRVLDGFAKSHNALVNDDFDI